MNWSIALRKANAFANAHLCSIPSCGKIKALPDQHSWLASSKLGLCNSRHLISMQLYVRRTKIFQDYILVRIY